jgi:signal transduction histidine kinase
MRLTMQTQASPAPSARHTAELRVLLIDDNLADRVHLSWLLRRGLGKQTEILEAEDGASALELLRRERVDLILVDYLLPDMNGLDVLDRLRELPGETATIFLTGQGNEKIAAEAIKRGALDYCVKRDLAWDKLQRAVSQSLSAARMRKHDARMVEQLRSTHLELDHFVRALSHDMSANFMLLDDSFRQLRRSYDPPPATGEFTDFSHVEACLRESKRFVDDLVTLARTGKIQMEPQRVELGELIEEVLFEQAGLLDERGVRVLLALPMPAVYCNPGRVKQVFVNLIRNAVRHGCDEERPEIDIAVIEPPAAEFRRRVWFRIHDNGPGIPEKSHDEIFLPGKRLPAAHQQGTGMGLAIVRKIIEHYGGSIFVDATCQHGAAFIFSLPAA